MSSWDELLVQVGALNAEARKRIQAGFKREIERQLEVQQMLRYGVCPCIVMGRYSTCCGLQLEPGEET
jgi:hypothetical protein